MQIKRNQFNEHIVKQVMNETYPGYHNTKNGNKCWSLYKGAKSIYSHDKTDPRVTLVLHRPKQSTYVTLSCDYIEVAEYITNHEYNFDKFVELDNQLDEYLTSEEGRWGI